MQVCGTGGCRIPVPMNDSTHVELRDVATRFRDAIERSIAERAQPHLPYFPDGACRLVSGLLAQHLLQLGWTNIRFRQATLPRPSKIRHAWLTVDGVAVDLTADPMGQPPVVVAADSVFHQGLTESSDEDAVAFLAGQSADVRARNARYLGQIEVRLVPDGAL